MRVLSKVSPLAAAVSLGVSALAAPTVASADVSASFAASNLYLFRGENLSGAAPAVSGSLDYSHDSGLYAGIWTSSEGNSIVVSDTPVLSGSPEYDLYVGFAGEIGSFGYDVAVVSYEYPGAMGSVKLSDTSELIIGLSVADFSLTIVDSLQTAAAVGGRDGYLYYALGYSFDKYSVTYGALSTDQVGLNEYGHIDISYAATDDLSFTLSSIVDDDSGAITETDALFVVTWGKSFDL